MKVQNILLQKVNFNTYKNQNQVQKPNLTLPFDSVSFSAKSKRANDFNAEAAKVGHSIYNMLLENKGQQDIYQELQRKAPQAKIRDISCLSEYNINSNEYAAYFSSKIVNDLLPCDMQFFLRSENPRTQTEKMLRAMDIAHEYTHYLQVSSLQDRKAYKAISNDVNYMSIVAGIGDIVFSIFDGKIKADVLQGVFADAIDFRIMNIIPKVKYVNQQTILNGAGAKNTSDFNRSMNSLYELIYIKNFEELVRHPERIAPEFQDTFFEILNSREKLEKLMKDVKKYCSLNAAREKQALKTETILAKQIMKTSQTLNYDAHHIFHDMLERALA